MQQKMGMEEKEEKKEKETKKEKEKQEEEEEEEEESSECAVFSTSPESPPAGVHHATAGVHHTTAGVHHSAQPESVHIDLSVAPGKSYWVSNTEPTVAKLYFFAMCEYISNIKY
jgi:hypothetical protein